MTRNSSKDQAVDELEQLGLREYEAKCFVSLTKISSGTARDVSEHIDIPRTRVYEAVRSLESEGLVEIQHTSPQRFRAVSISEAIEILEGRYRSRIETLEDALEDVRQSNDGDSTGSDPEVWSFVGGDTVAARAKQLIDDATAQVLLLVGDDRVLSPEVADRLVAARDRGVDVVVGTGPEPLRERFSEILPDDIVSRSRLEWLRPHEGLDGASIGCLLLVDDDRLLTSTLVRSNGQIHEHGVCGNGTDNCLVLVARQLLGHQLEA